MSSIAAYYDLETEMLIADGKRVALFTKHPGTLGAYREARLRQYLKDHVARRFEVASGFISDRNAGSGNISDVSSKQIDCLIFDQLDRAKIVETDAFVCVEPDQAVAFVEVKSTLTLYRESAPAKGGKSKLYPFKSKNGRYRWAGTLVEALSNIASAVKIMEHADVDRIRYFAGIVSYDGDSLKLLDAALNSGQLCQQLEIETLDQLPDCISVLTRGWWSFEAYEWDPEEEFPINEPEDYRPNESVLVKETGFSLKGAPLQIFTAYFGGRLNLRAVGASGRLDQLRSASGRHFDAKNTRFPLPCPGREIASTNHVNQEEIVADVLMKIKRDPH